MRRRIVNVALVVAGAAALGACATIEDVRLAQATANEALLRADQAMGTAQTALVTAQTAEQAAAAAAAEARNAAILADQARFEAQAAAQRPQPMIVARGERG